jgi:hypothetical protein
MCFQLYAATSKPLPRRKWVPGFSDLAVESLTEHDAAVKAHFNNPEVQFIGSTSGCGCDFPHIIFQNGGWPHFEDPEVNAEQAVSDQLNRESLVSILRLAGDPIVEVYGMWDGDFSETPEAHESISVCTILKEDFRFKERVFYTISVLPE